MKSSQGENRFNATRFGAATRNPETLPQPRYARSSADGARSSVGTFTKIFICALMLAFLPLFRVAAQSAQQWKLPDIPWAFPVRGKAPPTIDERSGMIHVPGSAKTYTQDQIDDLANPPDWFPDEHAPMPHAVAHGGGGAVLGCASCHLASGLGHPESANLAGLSAAYIVRQLNDFKNGARFGEAMPAISKT